MRLLLATGNQKKLAELRRIIDEVGADIEVLSKAEFGDYPDPPETGHTFEENALIKARAGAELSGLPTVADDSGICVDVLNQMPGVRSARWAGSQHDDLENLELLLRQIDDVPSGERGASFVAAVAIVQPDGTEATFRGVMPGYLVTAPRGANGFGYDPIFVPTEFEHGENERTSAELSAEEKDAISHRGKALRMMMDYLGGQQ